MQAGGQADVDVIVLVGGDPLLTFHGRFAHHGASFHGSVDFVTGAVEEAGVDKHHALAGGLDAGFQVDGGAPLLIHDADFQGVARQAEDVFDAGEQLVGERRFCRAVHLRLDDVHRAGAGVVAAGVAIEVVNGDQAGQQTVHYALRNLEALTVDDGIDGHQVTDVAHEQQGATMQSQLATVGLGIDPVRVHGAGEGGATLAHGFGQVALHQAQPVAIDHDFVIGIDCGNRIFAVHDGGQRGFHQHVFDPGGIGAADRATGVDLDFEMQAVLLE